MADSGAPVDPAAVVVASRRRWLVLGERLIALLLAASVFTEVQVATPNQVGEDGYYHIKVAWLILQARSPRIDFPYLPYTIINPRDYTDHHLLFHLLQAPFTLLDLQLAAKLSAAVFASLSAWGIYLLMARQRVRWPLFWLALLLAVAHTFLWRHSMPRPQSPALLLIVAVLVAVTTGRLRWLLPLGFVSAWLFDGFILPLVVPAAAAVARLMLDRRLEWRPLAALLLGTALGLVIHPYFPNNVQFAALHLLPKSGLGGPTEVPVGNEWYRYNAENFLTRVGPSLAVMCVGLLPVLARLWRQERPSYPSMTLTVLALIFLALQVRSQRIIEYYPAIAVLLPAWSWSFDRLAWPARLAPLGGWIEARRLVLSGLVALLLLAGLTRTVSLARRDARGYDPIHAVYGSYRDAALWLAANSAPGDLVFNTDWDDFPQLFFWNSHNAYASGLDSTYLYLAGSERWRAWKSIASGEPQPSVALRRWFDAKFVFSDPDHTRFLSAAAADPDLELVFNSPTSYVYRVLPASR